MPGSGYDRMHKKSESLFKMDRENVTINQGRDKRYQKPEPQSKTNEAATDD